MFKKVSQLLKYDLKKNWSTNTHTHIYIYVDTNTNHFTCLHCVCGVIKYVLVEHSQCVHQYGLMCMCVYTCVCVCVLLYSVCVLLCSVCIRPCCYSNVYLHVQAEEDECVCD